MRITKTVVLDVVLRVKPQCDSQKGEVIVEHILASNAVIPWALNGNFP